MSLSIMIPTLYSKYTGVGKDVRPEDWWRVFKQRLDVACKKFCIFQWLCHPSFNLSLNKICAYFCSISGNIAFKNMRYRDETV